MSNREITYTRILIVVYLILAMVGALCLIFGVAHAAPAQTPYLSSVKDGVIIVYYPYVTGYDSGYVTVINTCTGEQSAVYLTWQSRHPLDTGKYTSDPRQLMMLGSCTYIITEGWVGYQEIAGLPYVFSFQVWRALAPAVLR